MEHKEPVTGGESSEESGAGTALEQHRYTLLVVEDSLEMQAFVVKQLSSEYRVLTAVNGVEALKVLKGTYCKSCHFRHYDARDGWIGAVRASEVRA